MPQSSVSLTRSSSSDDVPHHSIDDQISNIFTESYHDSGYYPNPSTKQVNKIIYKDDDWYGSQWYQKQLSMEDTMRRMLLDSFTESFNHHGNSLYKTYLSNYYDDPSTHNDFNDFRIRAYRVLAVANQRVRDEGISINELKETFRYDQDQSPEGVAGAFVKKQLTEKPLGPIKNYKLLYKNLTKVDNSLKFCVHTIMNHVLMGKQIEFHSNSSGSDDITKDLELLQGLSKHANQILSNRGTPDQIRSWVISQKENISFEIPEMKSLFNEIIEQRFEFTLEEKLNRAGLTCNGLAEMIIGENVNAGLQQTSLIKDLEFFIKESIKAPIKKSDDVKYRFTLTNEQFKDKLQSGKLRSYDEFRTQQIRFHAQNLAHKTLNTIISRPPDAFSTLDMAIEANDAAIVPVSKEAFNNLSSACQNVLKDSRVSTSLKSLIASSSENVLKQYIADDDSFDVSCFINDRLQIQESLETRLQS